MKTLKVLFVLFLVIALSGCSSKEYNGENVVFAVENKFNFQSLDFEIIKSSTMKEVKPQNPQGYYPHYKEEEGYHYYVLYGKLKNNGKSLFDINNIKVMASNDSEKSKAKLVLINEIESYFWDEIPKNSTLDFYLFTIVKDTEENPDSFIFYYDKDNIIEEEQHSFDYELHYKIPNNI